MTEIYRYEIRQQPKVEEVDNALAQLPAWRREKARAYRRPLDRFLCAKAYLLLAEALKGLYGLEEFAFEYGPGGKPSIEGRPDIHFNLSHCSSCVCCIVSDKPAGIDVEDIQYDPALAQAVLNPDELASVQDDAEFTRLWTMKESFLKLKGEGLHDNLKDVLTGDLPNFKTETNREYGYVLCSAQYK